MLDECRRLAEALIERIGLQLGQYEMEVQGHYFQYYIHPASGRRRLKFCSILCRQDGLVTVYASGDFDDPDGRFTRQPSQPQDAFYRFSPDDERALHYAERVVLSAYRSRA